MKPTFFNQFVKKYYPFIIFTIVYIFIFNKVFLNGLVPFPSDLLVSFFFPFNSGGWEGYQTFVSHKEFIASDVVRQIYPWRVLAMDIFKSGQIPLWNPYAFAGTPLLANIQSAVFYPGNILFFFFDNVTSWIIYILLQPVIAFFSMYQFIRSLKLGKESALLSGIAYGFIGYVMIWFELGVVGHTAAWLPLGLYGINRFSDSRHLKYLLITVVSLTVILLAGHAQTAVYCYLLTFFYFISTIWRKLSLSDGIKYSSILFLPFGLAAIQLIPSIELLSYAARNANSSAEVFYRLQLPFQHLLMLFAPDFFGNPATKNFWGTDYNEFLSYIGVVALVFSFIGIGSAWKDHRGRFFIIAGVIALLFALPTPFSNLLQLLNVPVLGTGIPARSLFILEFSLVVVAAYGVATLWKGKISYLPFALLGIVYGIMWGLVYIFPSAIPNLTDNVSIAKRNLLLPSILVIVTVFGILIIRFRPTLKYLVFFVLIGFSAFEYHYLFSKYLPFAPVDFIFPNHPLIQKLQETSDTSRIYGYDSARIETNFPTAWKLYSPEGYDPLYIRRYGELLHASQNKGSLSGTVPRSDAVFATSLPVQDSPQKQFLMNLMDVRYIADKDDAVRSAWQPDTNKYPEDRFSLIWQYEKWKIYENKKALPRSQVFYSWETIPDATLELDLLMKPDFPYTSRLTLGGDFIGEKLASKSPSRAEIVHYSPNRVRLTAQTLDNGLLFLSDVYYPGWNAYVNGVKTAIFPVNYTFRGVPVMKGNHTVDIRYEPLSFYLGAIISGVSFMVLSLLFFRSNRKEGRHHAKK